MLPTKGNASPAWCWLPQYLCLQLTNHSGTLLHISDVAQLTAQQKKSSVGDNLNIGISSAVLLSLQQEISDHMMSWTPWVFASGA